MIADCLIAIIIRIAIQELNFWIFTEKLSTIHKKLFFTFAISLSLFQSLPLNLAVEENHSLHFTIVEKVVKWPQASVLAEWVRIEIWVVAVVEFAGFGWLVEDGGRKRLKAAVNERILRIQWAFRLAKLEKRKNVNWILEVVLGFFNCESLLI